MFHVESTVADLENKDKVKHSYEENFQFSVFQFSDPATVTVTLGPYPFFRLRFFLT